MVTNLCPHNGNEQWCAAVGGTNAFGYPVHFDLRNAVGQIDALNWDNPEVTYQKVSCSTGNALTPRDAEFATCQCGGGSDGGSDGSDGSDGGDGGSVPSSFVWASGVNSWWVAFGLNARSVSMDCGGSKGFKTLTKAGWTLNNRPVWIWEKTGYQCAKTVTIKYDGKQFTTTRP